MVAVVSGQGPYDSNQRHARRSVKTDCQFAFRGPVRWAGAARCTYHGNHQVGYLNTAKKWHPVPAATNPCQTECA